MLVAFAFIIRLVFRKAPKSLICVLWLVVFLRLLIPFQLETSWALRPVLPVLTAEDTQLFIDAEPVMQGEIPDIIPQQSVEGTYLTVVDYLGIAGTLWLIGIAIIGIYTLVSYLKLVFWVREAHKEDKRVYVSANVETAFLLGYFTPKIYIPVDLPEEERKLVVNHENVHIRRGDNWLKLLGFVAVILHWFNPLVWVAYTMLCRDIEYACDARVVRDLEPEQRKTYATALLSCGKKSRKVFGCPVAFGEISIRKRIVRILHYSKPAYWINILVLLVIMLFVFFLVPDPISQIDPPYYETMRDLLGQPMDVVCEKMDLSEEELIGLGDRTGYYDTPLEVEYQGVTFRVRFGFSIHNDLLYSFTYYATYEGNHEQAATDIVKVSNRLWDNFGKGYQWYEQENPERLKESTVEDILAQYTDRDGTNLAFDQWNLTYQASKSVEVWLDQIAISNQWHSYYAELSQRYNVGPHYFLEYTSTYDEANDLTMISMKYTAGWQPGHYSSMTVSDYS